MAPTTSSKYSHSDLRQLWKHAKTSIIKQWAAVGMIPIVEMGWVLEVNSGGARMVITYHAPANKTTGIYTEVL